MKGGNALPCVLFEDADLIAVHKPSGIGTHAAAVDAPWGIVELLQNRLAQKLGIHQRLDRETSGVLVFAKSPETNRSLSVQFEGRRVEKEYLFVTTQKVARPEFTVSTPIEGKTARTRFSFIRTLNSAHHLWKAHPETGRTHQIRIHAKSSGLPIVGDDSTGRWEPLLLHAHRLSFHHPSTHASFFLEAPPPDYFSELSRSLRCLMAAEVLRNLILEKETHAWRWIHREADGFPEISVDALGEWLYLEQFHPKAEVSELVSLLQKRGVWQGLVTSCAFPEARRTQKRIVFGAKPEPFTVVENGIRYQLDLMAPGNPGLFLDQRENRRRIQSLSNGKRMLNLFAYTCGFSVAAAKGGAKETVSVDLSKNYLERGRQNFIANDLALDCHRFLARDTRQALKQFAKHEERFDLLVLDPPSSARSKTGGHFSVKRDLKDLVRACAEICSNDGWLLISCNLADWKNAAFLESVREGVRLAKRKIGEEIWMPQPFDFPATARFPSYFKSVWLKLA